MITRLWRGWTEAGNADDYERFLLDELFPAMRAIPGFRGADVLRRPDGDEVAFVTLTRFESIDAIRAFAGEPYDVPVLEPRALELLSRHDERAQHFATATFDVGARGRTSAAG
jgi:antibiotic biosynthesis monooxygenase (ABM) superfamily enzyme